MIRYARGASKFDAHPEIREAPDFDAFEQFVLADRAEAKGRQYICAPFVVNGDGRSHRGKDNVEPRRFLALDIDRIAGTDTFANLRLWLARFHGFGFTTASSTQEAPRCRVIIELDRDVDRLEGIRVGAALAHDIGAEFGDAVQLDQSTHRGEQPCYLPMRQSESFRLDGDPLDADAYIENAPEIDLERKGSAAIAPDDDPVIVALKERGMYRRDLGAGRHAIRCPWEAEHTTDEPDTSTATAYLQPHHQGFVTPGFRCQHDHCRNRRGDDLLAFLGLDWRTVAATYKPARALSRDTPDVPAYIDEIPAPAGATAQQPKHIAPSVIVRVSPLDWGEVKRTGKVPRRWAIGNWLSYDPTLFAGAGGIGKTLLAQQIGMSLALGKNMLGAVERELRVLMWACEDSRDELGNRAIDIASHLGIDLETLGDRFTVIPRRGLENTLFAAPYDQPVFTPLLGELEEQINDLRINVLFLDNIGQIFAAQENNRHHVTKCNNGILGCARHDDFAPVIMGHPAKALGSEYSGSTAWENAVRMRWYLGDRLPDQKLDDREATDPKVRILAKRKTNYSAKDWRRFTFENGVLIPEQFEVDASGTMDMLRRRKAKKVVLEGLRKLTAMGRTCSESAASNYLPRLLLEHHLSEGLSKGELKDAMLSLMNDARIKRAPVGAYGSRHQRFGLVEIEATDA